MSCLKCLKYTMCVVNFIFFVCGAAIFGLGIYMSTTAKHFPSFSLMNFASALFVIGIFVTSVSFLGFLGALKENRCLLISFFILLFLLMLAELTVACLLLLYDHHIDTFIENELKVSINNINGGANNTDITWNHIQEYFHCCGVNNVTDWSHDKIPESCCELPPCTSKNSWDKGCYYKLKEWLGKDLLGTGITVIVICSIEVLGMCFSMTLFCHISKSGLGYK